MSTFNNGQCVQNQVGHQSVGRDVNYHYYHQHADATALQKRSRWDDTGTQHQKQLDDAILESLAFPEMTQRRRNIESPHGQTCQWIFELDQYRQWTADSSGLLWIKGKPGAGKSTLMSHLYSITQTKLQASTRQQVCLEYFFTARGVALERSGIGMLRSVLNQIFHLDPSIRQLLRTPYEHKQMSFGNVGWQWQQQELQILFTDLVLASAKQRPVIVFIDALDEAGKQDAEELAHYLHLLCDKADVQAADLKVAISCRHYPVPLVRRRALEIYVEKYNHKAISSFVQDFIDNYIVDDESESQTWQELSKTMSNMANGVFQWVRLVVPLLRRRAKGGESPKQILHALSNISTDLDQVYKHILEQVIEDKERALRLFQWVCLATRPLSLTELRYAIATHDLVADRAFLMCHESPSFIETDERMSRCLGSWSGGLIEVVETGTHNSHQRLQQAQPIHLSVKDFFMRQGFDFLVQPVDNLDEADGQNATEPPSVTTERIAMLHSKLYWCCLQYISSEDARFSAQHYPSDRSTDDSWKREFPLMRYTVSNIIHHAKHAQAYRGRDLAREKELLDATVSAWTSMWAVCGWFSDERLRSGTTTLHVAAAAGLIDLVVHVLKYDCNVSGTDEAGQTALHLAAKEGNLAIVQILLEAKADINKTTVHHETALTFAAQNGHKDVFSCLLQHGASLTASKSESASALYVAADENRTEIVKLCIDAGADVNTQGGFYGNALQAAAKSGYIESVKLLLDAGANVNAQGGWYGNALQAAALSKSTESVKILLDAGANVNAQGGLYGNALQAAALSKSTESVKILLDAGAIVNAQGGEYGNALQAAAASSSLYDSTELVKILLDIGANVNAQGGRYGNALQAAAKSGYIESVKILLDAGANVNAQGGLYGNALQAAAVRASRQLVKILLDAGADVNAQGGKYGSALSAARFRNRSLIMRILVEAGAVE